MFNKSITVGDMNADLKKARQREYNARYRAKQKLKAPSSTKPELTPEELSAKYEATRAKMAEYQKRWREKMTPEQREAHRLARNAYANARYAKMRAAYEYVQQQRELRNDE